MKERTVEGGWEGRRQLRSQAKLLRDRSASILIHGQRHLPGGWRWSCVWKWRSNGGKSFALSTTAQLGAALKLAWSLFQPDKGPSANEFSLCSSISDPLALLRLFIRLHFPALSFSSGVPCCHCDLLQQPSSLLLFSVLRWDEVALRYMSRFVGKTMVGSFFSSPEAGIPSSFCHNKGDRKGKWKAAASREWGKEEQRCDERGEGQIKCGQGKENQKAKSHGTISWTWTRRVMLHAWGHY